MTWLRSSLRVGVPRALALCLALTAACADNTAGTTVRISVVSDLVGTVDFDSVDVAWLAAPPPAMPTVRETATHIASANDSFVVGVIVAEFEEVPAGNIPFRVRLRRTDGTTLTTRTVVAAIRAGEDERSISLRIARSCVGVDCPEIQTCIAGICGSQNCFEGNDAVCPDDCVDSSECSATAACATPACRGGVCLGNGASTGCSAGQMCHAVDGCVTVMTPADVGPPDTMSDAGADVTMSDAEMDATPDASEDAAPDSEPDATPDAAPDATEDAAPDAEPDATMDAEPDGEPDTGPPAVCDLVDAGPWPVAHYAFAGGGTTASDTSMIAPNVPLTLEGTGATINDGSATFTATSEGGGFVGGSLISGETESAALRDKLITANALTAEVWVEVDPEDQFHSRILTFSHSDDRRGFTIAHGWSGTSDAFAARVRTSATDPNGVVWSDGEVSVITAASRVTTGQIYHVVLRYKTDGTAELFVDGELQGTALHLRDGAPGVFDWTEDPAESDFRILIGNERGDDKAWRGTIYSASIWDRALDDEHITLRHECGRPNFE